MFKPTGFHSEISCCLMDSPLLEPKALFENLSGSALSGSARHYTTVNHKSTEFLTPSTVGQGDQDRVVRCFE